MEYLKRMALGCYKAIGSINFDNAASVEQRGKYLFEQDLACGQAVNVNFAELVGGDSSTLSMVLSWVRFAQQSNHSLSISDVPEELVVLAKVCGLESILKDVMVES